MIGSKHIYLKCVSGGGGVWGGGGGGLSHTRGEKEKEKKPHTKTKKKPLNKECWEERIIPKRNWKDSYA